MYDDLLKNMRFKVFIDGEYKGVIMNGDPLPKEWISDCGKYLFRFEVDMEVKTIWWKDAVSILNGE